MQRIVTTIAGVVILLLASISAAQQASTTAVPNLIRYAGMLHDSNAGAMPSATVGVTFAIYKQQDGGAPLWQETQNVTSDAAGNYAVLLGSTTASGLPGDLFSQQEQRWLGVQLQGEAEQPRVLMVSVPYAFKAQEAETLGGLPASAFVKAAAADTSGGTTASTPGTGPQTTTTPGSGNTGKPVGIDTVVNCATSATNYIPVFTSAAPPNIVVCNSVMYQLNSNIGVGNTAPVAKLDVTGNINTSLAYQIGESTVMSIGSPADSNLFLGRAAGAHNAGTSNTFSGSQAGYSNTTGAFNTFSGSIAGNSNTTGSYNTYSGYAAGGSNASSYENTFVGAEAGTRNTGAFNTFTGSFAGASNTTGSYNTYLGRYSGYNNTSGTNDIYIGNEGPQAGTESSTIRIGGDIGYGSAQTAAYIAGIYNAATSGGSAVFIDSTGKLGTAGGASFNISGNGTAGGTLSGNAVNSATNYQVGSSGVMSIGSAADANLFLGVGAGASNVAGSGQFNTFSGYQAGNANTTGVYNTFTGSYAGQANTGSGNTFIGTSAGRANTTGYENTFTGLDAGYSNTGGYTNTFIGSYAGFTSTGGVSDTFTGWEAGYSNTVGPYNTFSGASAGFYNQDGQSNTFTGSGAGYYNTHGSNNTYIGSAAGFYNVTGNNNIYIGNYDAGAESNTIRIGGDTGYGAQTATYMAGIYGVNVGSGNAVYINSSGQLGTLMSSRRFKEQIADMGESTSALMKLRPVTYLYKAEYDKGERTLQYGLIAEEVAEVYPDLVAYDQDGQPYTVKYQYLISMLLNELQKQYQRGDREAQLNAQQQHEIEAQRLEIRELREQLQMQEVSFQERLTRLEKLAAERVDVVAQK